MGGGQDKPAWTACPPGAKITRAGGKITRDWLPPGGQAVQGVKINCYTGSIDFTSCGYSFKSSWPGDFNKFPQLCEENYPLIIVKYQPYLFRWIVQVHSEDNSDEDRYITGSGITLSYIGRGTLVNVLTFPLKCCWFDPPLFQTVRWDYKPRSCLHDLFASETLSLKHHLMQRFSLPCSASPGSSVGRVSAWGNGWSIPGHDVRTC